jgi:hypothetical protein
MIDMPAKTPSTYDAMPEASRQVKRLAAVKGNAFAVTDWASR